MPHPCSLVVLSNESVVQFQDVLLIVELEVQSYEESVLDELSEITEIEVNQVCFVEESDADESACKTV